MCYYFFYKATSRRIDKTTAAINEKNSKNSAAVLFPVCRGDDHDNVGLFFLLRSFLSRDLPSYEVYSIIFLLRLFEKRILFTR